jgi:hypothetical protein
MSSTASPSSTAPNTHASAPTGERGNDPLPVAARSRTRCQLAPSAYDQAASGLVTALAFVGLGVLLLAIIFFSARMFAQKQAIPVTIAEVGGRDEGSIQGAARDLEEPGSEDVPDLMQEPSLNSVEQVTDAISSKTAVFDDVSLDNEFVTGPGKGKGDNRQTGSGSGDSNEQVPRAQRWVIHFDGGNLKMYAKQLDFFKIELAAIGGPDNVVHYAFNLSKPRPDYRTGSPSAEQRLYMTWRGGALQAADRELLSRTGVDLNGRVMMQFYPAETENMLSLLERQYAGNQDINKIRRTTFGLLQKGEGFEFVVTKQETF